MGIKENVARGVLATAIVGGTVGAEYVAWTKVLAPANDRYTEERAARSAYDDVLHRLSSVPPTDSEKIEQYQRELHDLEAKGRASVGEFGRMLAGAVGVLYIPLAGAYGVASAIDSNKDNKNREKMRKQRNRERGNLLFQRR